MINNEYYFIKDIEIIFFLIVVFIMAYDVTTEWDDIHRKLGNYEALPIEKKEHEYTKEYIE